MRSTTRTRHVITRVAALAVGFALVAAIPAIARPDLGGSEQLAQFTAPDGVAGDQFGYSVSLDGDVALVGANLNSAAAYYAGAAYVYEATDSAWTHTTTLRPADLGFDDRFGQAVAVSGDLLVVGAPRDDDLGADTGAVYVYRRTAEDWALEAKLLPVGGIEFGRAGAAVAVDGDTIAFSGGRRIFVYVHGVEGWTQQSIIMSPTGIYDYFGSSIALSADTLISGAHGYQSIYDEGRAYVFNREAETWSLQATLAASDGESNDMFGVSVDIEGDTALVGAWGDDDAGSAAGAGYVFSYVDGVWAQSTKIVPTGATSGDEIGYFVSLADGWAALSAHGDDQGGLDSGAAYVFDATNGWSQVAKLTASDGASGDVFGNPSVSAERVLVGSMGSDVLDVDAGAAYLFGSGEATTKPGKGGPQQIASYTSH